LTNVVNFAIISTMTEKGSTMTEAMITQGLNPDRLAEVKDTVSRFALMVAAITDYTAAHDTGASFPEPTPGATE